MPYNLLMLMCRQSLTFIDNGGKRHLHCLMNRLPYVRQLLPHSPTSQAKDTDQAIPPLSLLRGRNPTASFLFKKSTCSLLVMKISSLTYIIVAMIAISTLRCVHQIRCVTRRHFCWNDHVSISAHAPCTSRVHARHSTFEPCR